MTSSSHRPWVNCLRAKYLKNTKFMHVDRTASSSCIWKGLLTSRSTISQGRCFLVGTGETIRTWLDPWIPSLPSFSPQPRIGSQVQTSTSLVSHFINSSSRSCDVCLLNSTFDRPSIANILQINIPPSSTLDKLV